jgi:hypothetical protein
MDGTGQACNWNTNAATCKEVLPEPSCSLAKDPSDCENNYKVNGVQYCLWTKSHTEKINVVSAPLLNYQFSTGTDAHFVEKINGSEYEKFANARTKAFPPSCSITVPGSIVSNAAFNISITYLGASAPSAIDLTVAGATASLASGLSESDSSDKIYDNGKDYYYTATLANADYVAKVTCADNDSNKVMTQKSFTVSKV